MWRNRCSDHHLPSSNCTPGMISVMVNTRQQTERTLLKAKTNLGTIEHMCQVVRHEGWERLYGGLIPSLVGTAASQGVYYYFYQIFREKVEYIARDHKSKGMGDGSVGMLSSLMVAALAGGLNVLLTNPIWVVVTRMQTHRKALGITQPNNLTLAVFSDESIRVSNDQSHYGISSAVREVHDEAGILGFWKGIFPTLVMVSNPSIQFMLYETMLKKLSKNHSLFMKNSHGISVFEVFVLGAMAKLGATIATYPLLVVKSRLQAKQLDSVDRRHHYKGTLDAVLKMVRHEGLHGFYKGMNTKIVQSVLAAAVLFMVKEQLVRNTRFLISRGRGGNIL